MPTQNASSKAQLDATIESGTLSDVLDTVNSLVSECKIHLTDDGIEVRAVDPANVGMVDIFLRKEAFTHYQTGGATIGVNVERLNESINMIRNGEDATLTTEDGKLNIKGDGLNFNLSLIDPDSIRAEPDLPDLDFPVTATVTGKNISRGLRAADMVGDHIELTANTTEQAFHMIAEGDTDDVDLELSDDKLVDFTGDMDASSIYSLDYLKDMNRAIPKDAAVDIDVGDSIPVRMSYEKQYGDLDDARMNVTFMLAPRIQSD